MLSGLRERVEVDATTVVFQLDEETATRSEYGAQHHAAPFGFARRRALSRRFDPVIDRVSDDVHQRTPKRVERTRHHTQAIVFDADLHRLGHALRHAPHLARQALQLRRGS
ncbi:MAG TPA: hypothetical protein VMF89_35730, partial [Polyangiales bacterium]|nr:hypothetical protein [Polyangiales bacterium]